MKREMFSEAMNQIPGIVAEIADWNGIRRLENTIKETVCEYTPSGVMCGRSDFLIDEDDLLDHIAKAKKKHYDIVITDTSVTIRRNMSDASYYIATYTPMA